MIMIIIIISILAGTWLYLSYYRERDIKYKKTKRPMNQESEEFIIPLFGEHHTKDHTSGSHDHDDF